MYFKFKKSFGRSCISERDVDNDKIIDAMKALPSNEENVKKLAKNMNATVGFTAGFWNYEDAEKSGSWSKRELDLGKRGVLYSDGNDNFRSGVYGATNKQDVFNFVGQSGWRVGAFGAIIENGVVQTRWEEGDPNVKNARNILVEFNDGTVKIIQSYGHFSTNNGLNHNEMVDLLRNFGIQNIKLAFNLDGGGSTRLYTKNDSGLETVSGSFVDNRTNSAMLGLVKKPQNIIKKESEQNMPKETEKPKQDLIEAPNTGFSKSFSDNFFAIFGGLAFLTLMLFRKRKMHIKF